MQDRGTCCTAYDHDVLHRAYRPGGVKNDAFMWFAHTCERHACNTRLDRVERHIFIFVWNSNFYPHSARVYYQIDLTVLARNKMHVFVCTVCTVDYRVNRTATGKAPRSRREWIGLNPVVMKVQMVLYIPGVTFQRRSSQSVRNINHVGIHLTVGLLHNENASV